MIKPCVNLQIDNIMKKEDFSITTSTVQSYKIRHKEGCYWADINIDNQEKGGRIQKVFNKT